MGEGRYKSTPMDGGVGAECLHRGVGAECLHRGVGKRPPVAGSVPTTKKEPKK